MFKKTMFVVGVMFAATIATSGSASASMHGGYRMHSTRAMPRAVHGIRLSRARLAFRGRPVFHGRMALGRSHSRVAFGHAHGRIGFERRGYRNAGFSYRRARLVAGRAAPTIQRYVGPRSRYVQTSSPSAGAPRSGVQTGSASFYSGGGLTAAGGHVGAATCAHRTLPFGTRVLVTNLANAHTAVLTVNDRGPFARGRIVDVSVGAAGTLGMLHSGTAPVRVQVLGGPG